MIPVKGTKSGLSVLLKPYSNNAVLVGCGKTSSARIVQKLYYDMLIEIDCK